MFTKKGRANVNLSDIDFGQGIVEKKVTVQTCPIGVRDYPALETEFEVLLFSLLGC